MNNSYELQSEIQNLLASLRSAQLATVNMLGNPEASYTPFFYQKPDFYIFISKLATHTNNLLSHAFCSLMLIEDECKSANIHARKRLTLSCKAVQLEVIQHESQLILDTMEVNLGDTMQIIRQLPDFCLFRLSVLAGRFVKGFGQAYLTDGSLDSVTLIKSR